VDPGPASLIDADRDDVSERPNVTFGITCIAAGAVALLSGLWWTPWQMQQARTKIVDRGRDPARFDAWLDSRSYRASIATFIGGGAVAIILGIVTLATT
jgi:hypothetical protein